MPELRYIIEAFMAKLETLVQKEVHRRVLAARPPVEDLPQVPSERGRPRPKPPAKPTTAPLMLAAPPPPRTKRCRGTLLGDLPCRRRIPLVWDLCDFCSVGIGGSGE